MRPAGHSVSPLAARAKGVRGWGRPAQGCVIGDAAAVLQWQPRCVIHPTSWPHLMADSGADLMVPPSPDARVVILGGGLAGISAAYHLKRPWLLLEKEERLGGHARTDQTNGFFFDKT